MAVGGGVRELEEERTHDRKAGTAAYRWPPA
jgi:hypothetical protein